MCGAAHSQIAFLNWRIASSAGQLDAELAQIAFHFRKAIELFPVIAGSCHSQLAGVFEEAGRWNEAIAEYSYLSESPDVLFGLAQCFAHLGNHVESVKYSLSAVKTDPRNDLAWKLLESELRAVGRGKEADLVAALFSKRGPANICSPIDSIELPSISSF